MSKSSIILASALGITFGGGQTALAKDPTLAADVQEIFGFTVSGAGPVTLIGAISRSMSGLAEDPGAVTALETISKSGLIKMVSRLSSEETKWPPNPLDAQAAEGSFERRWYRER